MKHLRKTSAILICCLLTAFAASAKDLFTEVKTLPGVESVHVNRFMMSIARQAVKMSAGKDAKTASEVLAGIKSMDIIECDHAASIPSAQKLARKAISAAGYEVALETKDEDETAIIYCQPANSASDSGKLKNVVIEVLEPKEYCILLINGTINAETFTVSAIK